MQNPSGLSTFLEFIITHGISANYYVQSSKKLNQCLSKSAKYVNFYQLGRCEEAVKPGVKMKLDIEPVLENKKGDPQASEILAPELKIMYQNRSINILLCRYIVAPTK